MAQAASPTSPGAISGLLASCRGTVYLLKNKKWDPLFGTNAYRLHLVRQAGNFILFVVDDQRNLAIKAKILLRFNTVLKIIKQNFFSLLDNGLLVWGFEISSQSTGAQTFSIVLQNTLTSLKESHVNPVNKTGNFKQSLPSSKLPEGKGKQQDYLNNICMTLSDAISQGNEQFASNLAQQLAAQKAAVRIRLDDHENDENTTGGDNKINIKVQVEDKESAPCSFRLDVAPQTTINQLKKMVQAKYNFPAEIQYWIIEKRLSKQNDSLADCGVRKSGHTVYLYLKSDDSANIGHGPAQAWGERREPAVGNQRLNRINSASDVTAQAYQRPYNDPRSLPDMSSQRIREAPAPPAPPPVGWICSMCTFVNSPSRPGCEMCSTDRPQDYQVPDGYVPDERERERLERVQAGEILLFEAEEKRKRLALEERDRNYQMMMSVALRQPLIANQEEIECPICFDTIPAGEGVVLRECLHSFCKDCLVGHINALNDAEVQCPYDNGDFQCHDVITTQEIQELLSEEDFQKYLQRSLSTAESQAANSFHCRTPNCNGWCIYDDEVNDFDCPVCQKRNCLTCKAIHFPVNCKEYQDDLKRNAANDEAARKTQEYLQEMLRTKDGMNCPKCGIILVKKDGCDWMKCSMCKTEICWAVRGPRWGPGGPGDTSGGCKCRVNNVKCHPKCGNCH